MSPVLRVAQTTLIVHSQGVNATAQDWKRVGEAIAARINQLKLTKVQVEALSGVSVQSIYNYTQGAPIRRADKEKGLCTALEWPLDAIERLLEGEDPADLPTVAQIDEQLQDQLARLRSEVEELRRIVESMGRSARDEERRPGEGPPEPGVP